MAVSVEFTFGYGIHTKDGVIRDMPAVPRVGEWVTIHGEDKLPQMEWRVSDVHWFLTSDVLQKRVLVEVILARA